MSTQLYKSLSAELKEIIEGGQSKKTKATRAAPANFIDGLVAKSRQSQPAPTQKAVPSGRAAPSDSVDSVVDALVAKTSQKSWKPATTQSATKATGKLAAAQNELAALNEQLEQDALLPINVRFSKQNRVSQLQRDLVLLRSQAHRSRNVQG